MGSAIDDVWRPFLDALAILGLHARLELVTPGSGKQDWDAAGTIEGVDVVVEVKANPGIGEVLALDRRKASDAYKILAARRISSSVRDALVAHDIGFFDMRGHLRLWHRPLLVDSPVAALRPAASDQPRWRIEAASALDVALAVLDGTFDSSGVRATAALLDRSPGTVSKQLAALRAAHLVDHDIQATVPELFETVLGAWHPYRVPLGHLPRTGAGRMNQRLRLGFENPEGSGWVLADVYAAAAWGAPVVLSGDAPPDFYVPDSGIAAQARALLGDAVYGRHSCTVAVAPAPSVCRRRYDRSQSSDGPFLAPSPVVAALDLATDPARGREMLELWSRHLPPELHRVW